MKVKRKNNPIVCPLGGNEQEQQLIQTLIDTSDDQEELSNLLRQIKGWQFEESGNLNQWCDVLDKFDAILEERLDSTPQLVVSHSKDAKGPTQEAISSIEQGNSIVFEILRFTTMLLLNSSHKTIYNSTERVAQLLGARNQAISAQAVALLAALVTPPLSYRRLSDTNAGSQPSQLHGISKLVPKLISLANGYGGRTQGNGLLEFLAGDLVDSEPLSYKFYSGAKTIVDIPIPVQARNDDCIATLFAQMIEQYELPEKHHFPFLAKVQLASSISSKAERQRMVMRRLYALVVLVHAFPELDAARNFFQEQPELTNEIVDLIRPENRERVPREMQIVALEVLTALVLDPSGSSGTTISISKKSSVYAALGIARGMPHGVLPSLQRLVLSQIAQFKMDDESNAQQRDSDMDIGLGVAFVEATTSASEIVQRPPFRPLDSKYFWIENVLRLIEAAANAQTGVAALTEYGIVPAIVEIISSDTVSPIHAFLTAQCIQVLELAIINHSAAATQYRDLNCIDAMINRLEKETKRNEELLSVQTSEETPPELALHRKIVVFSLLNTMCMSFHTQGAVSSSTASLQLREGSLVSVLKHIFQHVAVYGGSIMAQACSLMSDIIQNQPTCVNNAHSVGLATVFLDVLCAGKLPPTPELVLSLPGTIGALSINSAGASEVSKYNPFDAIMNMFVDPAFVLPKSRCLQGDLPAIVGSSLDELMRQADQFRQMGMESCVKALARVLEYYNEDDADDEAKTARHKNVLEFVTHIAQMLEPMLSKPEHATAFADAGGVDSLLALYPLTLPSTHVFLKSVKELSSSKTDSSGHFPAANALSVSVRAFGAQHPMVLLSRVIREIEAQLEKLAIARTAIGLPSKLSLLREGAEGILNVVPNTSLEELDPNLASLDPVATYLRCLSMIEWLLGVLHAMLRTAYSGAQHHQWFSVFTSTKNQDVVKRLFSLDRSVQWELATVRCGLRDEQKGEQKEKKDMGVRDVGCLLLDRFTAVTRDLLAAFAKAFSAYTPHHRRTQTNAPSSLAPHADPMMKLTCSVLRDHLYYALGDDREIPNEMIKCEYLGSVFRILQIMLYDDRKRTSHTILQRKLAVDSEDLITFILKGLEFVLWYCINHADVYIKLTNPVATTETKDHVTVFSTVCRFIQRYSTVEQLISSHTRKLFSNLEYPSSSRDIAVKIHTQMLQVILPVWRSPQLTSIPILQGLSVWIPVVIQILSDRLDTEKGLMDSENEQKTESEKFQVDEGTLDQLVAMGFPRSRGEHALRRLEMNNIEMAMDFMLANSPGEVEAEEKKEEAKKEIETPDREILYKRYEELQENIHCVCFDLVKVKAKSDIDTPMDIRALTLIVAQFLIGISKKSETLGRGVIADLSQRLIEACSTNERREAELYGMSHLMALLLLSNPNTRRYVVSDCPTLLTTLLQVLENKPSMDQPYLTTILLIFDSLVRTPQQIESLTDAAPFILPEDLTSTLTQLCTEYLDTCDESKDLALAVVQLIARLTRHYPLALQFIEANGLERLFAVKTECKTFITVIARHVLEDDATLQLTMENEIEMTIQALIQRYGPPAQMRISPRIMVTALLPMIYRNPSVFDRAISNIVKIKKSGMGRYYVDRIDKKDRKESKVKASQQHVEKLMDLMIARCLEDPSALQMITDIITTFPLCAISLYRYDKPLPTIKKQYCSVFISHVLQTVVPTPEYFLKSKVYTKSRPKMMAEASDIILRGKLGRRFVLTLCSRPGGGSRRVLKELCFLIQNWKFVPLVDASIKKSEDEEVTEEQSLIWSPEWTRLWMVQSWIEIMSHLIDENSSLTPLTSPMIWENTKLVSSLNLAESLIGVVREMDLTLPVSWVLATSAIMCAELLGRKLVLKKVQSPADSATLQPPVRTSISRRNRADEEDVMSDDGEEDDDEAEDNSDEEDDEEDEDEDEDEEELYDEGSSAMDVDEEASQVRRSPLFFSSGRLSADEDDEESNHRMGMRSGSLGRGWRSINYHQSQDDEEDDDEEEEEEEGGNEWPSRNVESRMMADAEAILDNILRDGGMSEDRDGFQLLRRGRFQTRNTIFTMPSGTQLIRQAQATSPDDSERRSLEGSIQEAGRFYSEGSNSPSDNIAASHPLLSTRLSGPETGRSAQDAVSGRNGRLRLTNPMETIGLGRHNIAISTYPDMELEVPNLERGWQRYEGLMASGRTGSQNQQADIGRRWTDDGRGADRTTLQTFAPAFESILVERLGVEDPVEGENEAKEEEEEAEETSSIIALANTLGESTIETAAAPDQSAEQDATPTEDEATSAGGLRETLSTAYMPLPEVPARIRRTMNPPTETTQLPMPTLPAAPFRITASDVARAIAAQEVTIDGPSSPPSLVARDEGEGEVVEAAEGENEDSEATEVNEEQEEQVEETTPSSDELVCPPGMDPEVFAELPEEMRREVVEANTPPSSADIPPESNFDPETLAALPEDIRQEVLAQERREREAAASATAASTTNAQDMDNASFVASLAPELRDEILVTSDDAFLATLPAALQAEARVLRDRAASQFHSFGFFQRSSGNSNDRNTAAANRRAEREASRLAAQKEADEHRGEIKCTRESELLYPISEEGIIAVLKCLFLANPLRGHVLKRWISQVCLYEGSRKTTIFHMFTIIRRILPPNDDEAEEEEKKEEDGSFPFPSELYGCSGVSNITKEKIPSIAIRRVLELLLVACRSIRCCSLLVLESYLPYIIRLIQSPVFQKSGRNMDMLVLVLESIVYSLDHLKPEDENKSTTPMVTEETTPATIAETSTTEESETSTSTSANADAQEEKLNPKAWYPIPQPVLSSSDCRLLIMVLSYSDVCTEANMQKARSVITSIAQVEANRVELLSQLIHATAPLIQKTMGELKNANNYSSMTHELELLRIVECISTLTNNDAAKMMNAKMDFTALFSVLSDCLISRFDATSTGTMTTETIRRYIPLIEIFFVVETLNDSVNSIVSFVEQHRQILNVLIRENPTLLTSSLKSLVNLTKCRIHLDFDNKRTYFQSQMRKLRQSAHRKHGSLRLQIRRDQIFEDSFNSLRMRTADEMRGRLHITFHREEGIDAGGLTREWYLILSREIFNPNYALFTTAADSPTFQPNPLSVVNRDHLDYFKFVGRIIGKAICDGQLLDAHFTRSFYKHLLGLSVTYHDIEAIDPEYYRNLQSLLNNSLADLGLELTFSVEEHSFGKIQIHDLKPNGRNIHVTDDNKMEYIKLVSHHRMTTGIQAQIDAFMTGFHQLVSNDLISIFNENELELLISGMPEIDIDDLKAHSDYSNYKPTDSIIRWFWNTMYSFTHEERALFVQFVTGTSKVPLEGFVALEGMRGRQKFNIHKAFGNEQTLPTAHTCFNQLDLPHYSSEEILRERLLFAIREGSEGFGFG